MSFGGFWERHFWSLYRGNGEFLFRDGGLSKELLRFFRDYLWLAYRDFVETE